MTATTPPAIRVLLADDHPVFLEGLALVLETVDEIEVVATVVDGAAAIAAVAAHTPDVAVLDLQMPHINGVEATLAIRRDHPQTAVLVLTMFEDDDSLHAALRAGARGYILKGARRDDIVRAIAAVHRGEAIFGTGVAERLLAHVTADGSPRNVAFPELTDREREILELIARGLNNAEIARRFALSPKTVRNHISNIFSKLHIPDRAQAIVRAREAGMGQRR